MWEKKRWALLLAALAAMFLGVSAFAEAGGSCGTDVTWTLDNSGVLTISGTGAMKDFGLGEAPWYNRKESIEVVQIKDGVTGIGEYAFSGCASLTDVYYTGDVDQWAGIAIQSHNRPLTSAAIHYNHRIITNALTLPASLAAIGSEAFAGLSGVDAVSIPATVTSIADDAFDAGVVVIAPAGSWAETWAKERGFTVKAP